MNKVTLIGRLLKEPEVKVSQSGNKYARVTVVTTVNGSDFKNYVSLTVWNPESIEAIEGLSAFAPVSIVGRIKDTKTTSKQGSKRSIVEMMAYEVKPVAMDSNDNSFDKNILKLVGRVVSKPTISQTGSGKQFTKVNVVVDNKKSKSEEGPADFFIVTLWGDNAVNATKLEKGNWFELDGSIKNIKYQSREGDMVYTLEIVAKNFAKKTWEKKNDTVNPEVNNNSQADGAHVYDDVNMNIDFGFADFTPMSDEDMPFM